MLYSNMLKHVTNNPDSFNKFKDTVTNTLLQFKSSIDACDASATDLLTFTLYKTLTSVEKIFYSPLIRSILLGCFGTNKEKYDKLYELNLMLTLSDKEVMKHHPGVINTSTYMFYHNTRFGNTIDLVPLAGMYTPHHVHEIIMEDKEYHPIWSIHEIASDITQGMTILEAVTKLAQLQLEHIEKFLSTSCELTETERMLNIAGILELRVTKVGSGYTIAQHDSYPTVDPNCPLFENQFELLSIYILDNQTMHSFVDSVDSYFGLEVLHSESVDEDSSEAAFLRIEELLNTTWVRDSIIEMKLAKDLKAYLVDNFSKFYEPMEDKVKLYTKGINNLFKELYTC